MASLQDLLKEEGFNYDTINPGPTIFSAPSRSSLTMPKQRTEATKPTATDRREHEDEPQEIDEVYDGSGPENGSSGRRSVDINTTYKHKYSNDLFEDENSKKIIRVKPSFNDGRRGREVALDGIVIKAVIAILMGHLRRYFKEESVRVSTYHRCLSCLGIDDDKDVGVVSSLKDAIRTIERAVVGRSTPTEVKKASLELSVITGLSSTDVTNVGCTFGIPNSHLAACAHLYLAVVHKFRRNDSVSAKHVLQVFCNSCNQARTTLLPGLWERLFLPHLSHLKEWFDQESESISGTKSWEKRNSLLEELYSKILDTATYQLTVYYMDWLEGMEAPDFPSILVPNASLPEKMRRASRSHSDGSDESSPSFKRAVDADEESAQEHELSPTDIRLADEWAAEGYYTSSKATNSQPEKTGVRMRDTKSLTGISRRSRRLGDDVRRKRAVDAKSESKKSGLISADIDSSPINLSTEPVENLEGTDQGSFFSSLPGGLNCPLTGQIFRDPVTLETGQTYERSAIVDWFDRGNKTCPVTKRTLQSTALPDTNIVMKHFVDNLKSEHPRDLLFGTTETTGKELRPKDEVALFVVEQLLTGFSTERRTENAKYVVSLGGLQFLLSRLESGGLDEKLRVVSLLLCCIQADGSCRSYLAANIAKKSILELLHSKQASARTAAVSLLIELISLKRRTSVASFLNELKTEAILSTVHVLLVHLQNSAPEERAMVAVLLLHFDLMAESRRRSVYREEAVDSITMAIDTCLSETKVVANTRRALLMLTGHFSSSGEVVTETRLLKQAGFYGARDHVDDDEEEDQDEAEAKAREAWSRTVSLVLLGSGKRSFLVTLARCLGSENVELARLCLTAVAWLSHTLSSLDLAEAQLSAFAVFVPKLKETLLNDPRIEHKVLASLSLHNFSKISEIRALLMKFGKEVHSSLESLMEVTWTANHLFAAICEGLLDSTAETDSDSSP